PAPATRTSRPASATVDPRRPSCRVLHAPRGPLCGGVPPEAIGWTSCCGSSTWYGLLRLGLSPEADSFSASVCEEERASPGVAVLTDRHLPPRAARPCPRARIPRLRSNRTRQAP